MKLEGSLDAFSLPDIFQLLSFTKKSGGLRLRHASAGGVVYFSEGFITGASADGSRQTLARRLIGSGAVDDDTLRAAVEAADETRGIGPRLVDAGVVDAELARQAAADQTVDSVFDLLRWPVGDFAFHPDAVNPDDVGLRLATEAVVAEAGQRQGAWDSAAAVIPGPDAVFTMPVVLAGEPTVTRDEWALLALVDGRRRVGDLVELTGSGQFVVVSALAGLVNRGLLQIAGTHDHVSTVMRRQAFLAPLEELSGSSAAAAYAGPVDGPVDDASVPAAQPVPPAVSAPSESASAVPEAETAAPPVDETGASEQAQDSPAAPAAVPAADPQPTSVEADSAPPANAPELAPLLGRAHVPGDVVPPRPEPAMPARRPDYPETPAARLTGLPSANQTTVGSAAVAAAPEASGLIERDPSVNRSLLLRLIAGVRGL